MKLTAEQKAKNLWGTTSRIALCIYILVDGIMLNGSYEGYQRDKDHREINEFLYHSKNDQYSEPMIRFIKRGNIRCNANKYGINLEFKKLPTFEQWQTLKKVFSFANARDIPITIEQTFVTTGKTKNYWIDTYKFEEWYQSQVNFCLY